VPFVQAGDSSEDALENGFEALKADAIQRAAEIATHLLGDANPRLSTSSELRFGAKGAVRVTVAGLYQGSYVDWARDIHGDIFDLIAEETGLDYGEAVRWSKNFSSYEGVPRTPHQKPPSVTSGTPTRGRAFEIWESSAPLVGSPAEDYLRSRIPILEIPGPLLREDALRWCDRDPIRGAVGSMVALMTGPTGHPVGIHRTFLNSDGKSVAKGFLGGRGVLGLYPEAAMPNRLLVGEGIETTISASLLFEVPAIAVLSAGALARFPVVPDVSELVVAADNDVPAPPATVGVGQRAMAQCRDRWLEAGRSVTTRVPKAPGTDFNDLLLEVYRA
jgi:putative DNA primase/helicase